MYEELQQQVASIIQLLVNSKFEAIEQLTKGVRLPADQIQYAIEQYGRKLVSPPVEAFELMDVIKVQGHEPQTWSVNMPLWTEEEGRSDLSIELTVIKKEGDWLIELNDIHVL